NLVQAHYYRGDYTRSVELAIDNLRALPAEWIHELAGAAPTSVYDRSWLIMSLADLGKFDEAAEYEAEAIRLAEPTGHAFTVGVAHRAAGTLHLVRGDWARAGLHFDRAIAVLDVANVVLLLGPAVGASACVLAQLGEADKALGRLREGERLLDR